MPTPFKYRIALPRTQQTPLSRAGFTLIEMTVVMVLISIVSIFCVQTISQFLAVNRLEAERLDRRESWDRLCAALRQDAHQAIKLTVIEPPIRDEALADEKSDETWQTRLNLQCGDQRVEYQTNGRGVQRLEFPPTPDTLPEQELISAARVHHEFYDLPGEITLSTHSRLSAAVNSGKSTGDSLPTMLDLLYRGDVFEASKLMKQPHRVEAERRVEVRVGRLDSVQK